MEDAPKALRKIADSPLNPSELVQSMAVSRVKRNTLGCRIAPSVEHHRSGGACDATRA